MSGRIFEDSENLSDDLSKILFGYFSQAAKKIVEEELRLEKLIAGRREDVLRMRRELASMQVQKLVAVLASALCAGLALLVNSGFWWGLGLSAVGFIAIHIKRSGLLGKVDGAESEAKGFGEALAAVKRDYKVHKLGVAYVPVASQVPFEGKSILIDHTGQAPERDFNLYVVKRQEEFTRTVHEMEQTLASVPMVEGSAAMQELATDEHSQSIQSVPLYDYLGKLDRQMRSAASLLNELDKVSVSLPVAMPGSPLAGFLKDHACPAPAGAALVSVYPVDAYDGQLEQFRSLNELRKSMESKTQAFEDFLQELMMRLARTVQAVSRMKMGSSDRMMLGANQSLYLAFKASFNHYSPKLEAEEIARIRTESFDYESSVEHYRPFELRKSSKVLYDPVSGNWVAEDGSRSSFPFGVHQIHEEIVAPIVQSLMAESRVERMRIYNSIKDQKLDYLNQWHRDTDDFYGRNRAEGSELINRMQASLTDFTAAYNEYAVFERTQKNMEGAKPAAGGHAGASDALGSSVVQSEGIDATSAEAYAMQSRQFIQAQQEFNEYMDRLKEEIDRKASSFKRIEYYDASLRDSSPKRRSSSLERVAELSERRRPLLAVDAFFAENAELPPLPQLDGSAGEALAMDLPRMVEDSFNAMAGAQAGGA